MQKLTGVLCPMVTPLDELENIDEKSTRKLVQRLVKKGVNGLFLLGTQGEFPVLTDDQKKFLVEIVIDEAKDKVPVLVNISDQGRKKTENFYDKVKDLGVDYYVLTAPGYYNVRSPLEIINYYTYFSEEVNRPIFVYDSKYTNNSMTTEIILKLSKIENVVGFKGGINFEVIRELAGVDNFSLFCGDEKNMDFALMFGYDGIIPGLSSLALDLYIKLFRYASEKEEKKAMQTQSDLHNLQDIVFGDKGQHWGNGHKYALSLLGICSEKIATTLIPLSDVVKKSIEEAIIKYEIS